MEFDDLPHQEPSAAPSFDAMPDHSQQTSPTFLDVLKSSIAGAPTQIYEAAKSAASDIAASRLNPLSDASVAAAKARAANPSAAFTDWAGTGADVASAAAETAAVPFAPVTNIVKAGAKAVAAPMTSMLQTAGEPIAKALNPDAKLPSYEEVYGKLEPEVEEALGLVIPKDVVRNPVAVPPSPTNVPVTLSTGQETGDIAAIQREQSALRNESGPAALARAKAFEAQQQAQIEAHKEATAAAFSPSGQTVVTSPQEAGEVVKGAVSQTEAARQATAAQQAAGLTPRVPVHPHDAADVVAAALRNTTESGNVVQRGRAVALQNERADIRADLNHTGGVLARSPQEAADIVSAGVTRAEEQATAARDAAYERFGDLPGSFKPQAFTNVANNVRRALNDPADPVILNDKTTPMAMQAIDELDRTLGEPARVAADPETKSYTPFTPSTVEDVRKRLVAYQRQANATARSTNDYSDVRAMGKVGDAFDDVVSDALTRKRLFDGDGNAVAAAQDTARGLHADLRRTFSPQGKGDTVGPIMNKIVGQREGQAAPANQIAQWTTGNGSTPVLVGRRLLSIFGPESPEIGSIKQGLFSKVVERPEGVTEWGPEKVADNIYDFVNGSGRELARTYFTPQELARMRAHADKLRASVAGAMPPTDVVGRAVNKINGIGGQPATSAELADTLFGRSSTGENPLGVKLAQHVKDTYGVGSDAFNALRSGMTARMMRSDAGSLGFDPAAISKNIDEFLDGRGRPMADTLFTPEEQLRLRDYSTALKDYDARMTAPKDPLQRVLSEIPGKTSQEVADLMYSRSVARDKQLSVDLANHLKSTLPPEDFAAVKQGMFRNLVERGRETEADWSPKRVVDRINKFLSEGKDLAGALYTPDELSMIRAYRDLHNKLIVPQAGPNWSGSSRRIVDGIIKGVGNVVGAMVGYAVAPGSFGVSEIVGATVGAKAASTMQNAMAARRVAKQLPLISEQMIRYQRAADRANRLNTPPSRIAETAATANLAQALMPIGIDMRKLAAQGPGTANAQQNQQNIPGPERQRKDGGAIEQKPQTRAHGGRLDDSAASKPKFHPVITGARLAPDGYYYAKDPNRPGKYLKVTARARPHAAA